MLSITSWLIAQMKDDSRYPSCFESSLSNARMFQNGSFARVIAAIPPKLNPCINCAAGIPPRYFRTEKFGKKRQPGGSGSRAPGGTRSAYAGDSFALGVVGPVFRRFSCRTIAPAAENQI